MSKGYCEATFRRVVVRLYVERSGRAGVVGDKNHLRMTVGIDGSWAEVLGRLIHEVMEIAAVELKLRFEPSDIFAMSNVDYLFVMPHQEFSDACDWAGDFLAKVLPWLREQWEEGVEKKQT
ncbi:MAG: hypothetical protein RBU21_05955 [FCB group bacterium]|jgi:hypothetical protein|nr:hypothetical protein [FCB group bacterium]